MSSEATLEESGARHRLAGKACAMAAGVACGLAAAGCRDQAAGRDQDRVTVYTSVDETFARELLRQFSQRSGVPVDAVFDSEAGKTTGLVNKIIAEAEAGRPRCDVFWSGELFNTIRLGQRGLLEPYESAQAADIPARFKDPGHRWTGLAARARVLAFDPARVHPDEAPKTWEALAEARYAPKVAIANPLFGTTCGHVAAMFASWGPDRGRAFLTRLRDGGAQIADGNAACVRMLMDGRVELAATDSDDVFLAQRAGGKLRVVYPDLGGGGTLMIPCSVAIIRGSPRPQAARRLTDFLVSVEAERLLATSNSRNVPVRARLREELGLTWPDESVVDYGEVAAALPEAISAVREILLR